jgi:hypothetical protein
MNEPTQGPTQTTALHAERGRTKQVRETALCACIVALMALVLKPAWPMTAGACAATSMVSVICFAAL